MDTTSTTIGATEVRRHRARRIGAIHITAIAEEFGSRGYLTPRLDALGLGRLTNHFIVGVVWGMWHLPCVAHHWNFTHESLWTLARRVVVGAVAVAGVLLCFPFIGTAGWRRR